MPFARGGGAVRDPPATLPAVRFRGLALALLVVVVAACKVDTTADVVIRQDGSGTVGVTVDLDAEAVTALGGVETVRTADLEAAGWTVAPPASLDGGGMTLSATKPFAGPGELAAIFQEINGPGGPFLQPRFERERSTFRNRFHFEATVDLTAPLAALDDPQLRDLLAQNGADVDALRAQSGPNLSQAVSAHLVVTMPGADSRRWDATANQRVEADVSTSSTRNAQVTKALVAAVLAVIALGVLLTGGLRALWGRVRGRWVPEPVAEGHPDAGWYADEWDDGMIDPGLAPPEWQRDWQPEPQPGWPPDRQPGWPPDGPSDEPAPDAAPPPGWDPYGSEPDPRRG